MATVRGMTPEAIRALLKKEIGDYQALSIAVSSAKGVSESALTEVGNLRNDISNMEFEFDDSKLTEAISKFDADMAELNKSLDEVAEAAIIRENKLTELELSLSKDRTKFDEEMQDLAQQLVDSKAQLETTLADAAEKLAQNVVDVEDKLSGDLDNAKKLLSESLAEDLEQLEHDLAEAFGNDLTRLENRQNTKTDALNTELNRYKSNTDSKVSTLLSEIDKAKAYATGFLQPGNLVWNPKALDNARYITTSNKNRVKIESVSSVLGGELRATKTGTSAAYINYGGPKNSTFELKKGDVIIVSAWITSSVELPPKAIGLKIGYANTTYYNPNKIPANIGVKISGEVEYNKDLDSASYFSVLIDRPTPQNAVISISEPHAKKKVTSDLIVDGAVTSDSIATGAIIAGKIATDAITANNIVAGSIGAKQIAAKAIGTDQLAANAVTADKIAALAVTAGKIAAKAVGTDQLVANAVTADKIKANAVTADKIDANAVTTQKLAAGAVTSREIAANSVTANHIVVAQPGNLIANGDFSSGIEPWTGAITAVVDGGGTPNGKYGNLVTGYKVGQFHGTDNWFAVEPGACYAFEIWLYATTDGSVFFMQCFNQDGKGAGKTTNVTVNDGDSLSSGNNSSYLVRGVTIPARKWTKFSCVYQMGPTTTKARIGNIWFNHQNGVQTGKQALGGVSLRPMADASLIVDGSVTAKAIAAGTITSKEISSGTITADNIASGTIKAGNIKSGELTSDNVTIKTGAIKTAMIGDGQITNAKIKDLNAGKITSGTIDANRIGGKSITGDKLAANTITGDKIAANTISAQKMQIKPGNLFPDPHFMDSCWGAYSDTSYNGSLSLKASGQQRGVYYLPAGIPDSQAIPVEPGASYLLTTRARFGDTSGVTYVSVYCRYYVENGARKTVRVAKIPRTREVSFSKGTTSVQFTAPSDMRDGACALGFFTEREHADGNVSLWEMSIVRAADASLIVDGSIETKHLTASGISADVIKGGTISGDLIKGGTIDGTIVKANGIDLYRHLDDFQDNMEREVSQARSVAEAAFDASYTIRESLDNHRKGVMLPDFYPSDIFESYTKSKIKPRRGWFGKLIVLDGTSSKLVDAKEPKEYLVSSGLRPVYYEMERGRFVSVECSPSTSFDLPSKTTWTRIPGVYHSTAGSNLTNIVVSGRLEWTNVNRGSTYGVRVVMRNRSTGAETIIYRNVTDTLGPLSPLGNPTWYQSVPSQNVGSINSQHEFYMEASSSNPEASKRRVTAKTYLKISYNEVY